jgi:hypothetical protein
LVPDRGTPILAPMRVAAEARNDAAARPEAPALRYSRARPRVDSDERITTGSGS